MKGGGGGNTPRKLGTSFMNNHYTASFLAIMNDSLHVRFLVSQAVLKQLKLKVFFGIMDYCTNVH